MNPEYGIGVISQKAWRALGTGPLDDCWLCSDLFCVHAVMPWAYLVGGTRYRQSAGVPDTNTGSEGGSIEASFKAIKDLWPALGALCSVYRGSWAGFLALLNAGHPASVSVKSGSLPTNLQFGYTGTPSNHRIAVVFDGTTKLVANPLAAAYAPLIAITDAALQKACLDYPDTAEANALVFPTVEQVFPLHPLYQSSGITQAQLDSAKQASYNSGYLDAKTKAASAVGSI